jgi:carboxyl-terminal processing protease
MLDREALKPSDDESMTAGAIQGLLESLGDPYALYFDPQDFEYFNSESDGEFYGIGVTIAERDGTVYVVSLIEGTPAEQSGLEPEDEVVSIDGVAKDRWDLEEVVSRVRGPEGTTVAVEVYRPDSEEKLVFEIERAKIELPNVMTRVIDGDIGYIRLLGFNNHAATDVRDAVVDLADEGAKGYVLDLRDNPGGLLDVSVDVASVFIEDGVIVRVEGGSEEPKEHRARGGAETDAPLVVLINGNSASASEIVAGAVQDYDRAVVVGETSFGKGSVQTVERLSFGGGIKFTIAHYVTPKGRVIDGGGVAPDVEVEMDPSDQSDDESDSQLQRAIDEVRAEF